jgi:hypothetical protein
MSKPGDGGGRGARRWRTRLALAAFGLAIAVALAEGGARAYLGPRFVFGAYVGPPQAICGEYDPELGWRNRPGTRAKIALAGSTYEVTINSRGQRGPERGYEKPARVKRVVLLGDSTAWGWGVGDEEMWPRLVERALEGRVEIVNLAVPGYGTDQELLMLEREGLKYEPDLVLLAFVHNDAVSNRFPEMQGMQKPVFERDAAGAWVLKNQPVPLPKPMSDLARRHFRRRLSMYSAVAALFEPPPPVPQRYKLDEPKVAAAIERFWNDVADPDGWTYMLLGRLREVSSAAGAELVVFALPHLVDRWLYDPTTPLPPRDGNGPYETFGTKKLAEAGRALGFETFSVDDALRREMERGANLDCGDEHLNARGNEIVAEVVAAQLRRRLE